MSIEAVPGEPGRRRMVQYERRSLELSAGQWRELERLARELGCMAQGGQRTGKPSWRAMMREIANSALAVMQVGEEPEV